MNRNVYLAGAAVAAACVTAGLVIIIGRPAAPVAAAPTTTAASTMLSKAPATSPPPRGALSAATSVPVAIPAQRAPVRPVHLRVSLPPLPAARQTDPMAVAQAAVATLFSVDPAVDSDRTDAARRAAYLLTPTFAASVAAPPTTGSGAQWQQWATSDAYVTVTSKKIDIAWTVADNRLAVVRNVGFIQTVHTAGGTTTTLPQQTLALTLVRAADGQPWRVDSMETP